MDFSVPLRTESDTSRMRKSSVGSRPLNVNPIAPIKSHNSVERKVSTNLFPTQYTLPLVVDKPTPEPTPDPEGPPEAEQLDIESWNSDQAC